MTSIKSTSLTSLIDPRITNNLRKDQIHLCNTIIEQAVIKGGYLLTEIEHVLLGMEIAGPLSKNCPTWRVSAITEAIESGPPWTKTLWKTKTP